MPAERRAASKSRRKVVEIIKIYCCRCGLSLACRRYLYTSVSGGTTLVATRHYFFALGRK